MVIYKISCVFSVGVRKREREEGEKERDFLGIVLKSFFVIRRVDLWEVNCGNFFINFFTLRFFNFFKKISWVF